MCKGKSTAYPSQTVFHNVCSGHAVLFLGLCDLGNKERHKASTRNCAPQVEGRYLQTCALLSLRLGRLFAPTGDLL